MPNDQHPIPNPNPQPILWTVTQHQIREQSKKHVFICSDWDNGPQGQIILKVLHNLWQSQRHVAGNRRSTVGAAESGGQLFLGMFALRGREAEPQEEAAITFIGGALCALSKAFSSSCTYRGIMTIERMKNNWRIIRL